MAQDIAGRGDPLKTLQLLWGKAASPRRGPRPKASLTEIVAAAVAIADVDGLEAVTTRRVAEAAGISPMSFYTHVPGKSELLDLMLDAALGLDETPVPAFTPQTWRANLRFVACRERDFYLRHPWALEISTHRPVLGPNTMKAYDLALSAVDGLGLDEIEMDLAVTAVANYVFGAVRHAARSRLVKDLTGTSDDEWWYSIAPFLETLDFAPYPVAARVGPVVGETYGLGDQQRAFEFGLERLLDGLEALVAGKRGPAAGR